MSAWIISVYCGTNRTNSYNHDSSPLPAHLLAVILLLIGFIGVFLHIINRRQRQKLLLAAPPGSIAAVVSLTSRSGFGELLLPYDNEKTLERKLNGLLFRLDKRTGAIVADDDDIVAEGRLQGPDDAMASLLGHEHKLEPHTPSAASSHTAYQASPGYPPWQQQPQQPSFRTPYDP